MTIHHIFANRANVGDWLSAKGIQSLLPGVSVAEHLCDDPFVADTTAALRACREGDTVVVGGGGLMMDYFAPLWEALVQLDPRVPVCLWGIGLCDIKREPSRPSMALVQEVVDRTAVCSVRDDLTRHAFGLSDSAPCPSLVALGSQPRPHRGLLHVVNHSTVGAEEYEVMRAAGQTFAERTGRPYRETANRLAHHGSERSLSQLLALYSESDLVLSSALHGCLFALAVGRPVIAVSGDWKIESAMAAAGLADDVVAQKDVADVGERLIALDRSPMRGTADFVRHAHAANQAVAAQVRSVAADDQLPERTFHA